MHIYNRKLLAGYRRAHNNAPACLLCSGGSLVPRLSDPSMGMGTDSPKETDHHSIINGYVLVNHSSLTTSTQTFVNIAERLS